MTLSVKISSYVLEFRNGCIYNEVGFCRLNQALLTLIPKRAGAAGLGDYRPISLIHLVAKIFAKMLSLRLAPRLNELVSPVQNAFIPGRSLHDNFMLVRQ